MKAAVIKTNLKKILPLRNLFLQENNFQIRYNACHERGWSDSYILKYNGAEIGYGSVKGNENLSDRDTAFEFYLVPPFRNISSQAFAEFLHTSKSRFIECQSNDLLLNSLLYRHAKNINSNVILFEDHIATGYRLSKVLFRKRKKGDVFFDHKSEPEGDYVLIYNKKVVASGGFLRHYNMPFADLYMEVKEDFRRKGFGSFLIQELKKECYLAGRVPAARCNIENIVSGATLLKGGFKVAGFMLTGEVKHG
jgi:GNAT superfamily N-acetyltransferase